MPEAARANAAERNVKVERPRTDPLAREPRANPLDLHAQVLHHQRTIGNRGVQRLIESGTPHKLLRMPPPPRRDGREAGKNAIGPRVQRQDEWYNIRLPGTNYRFDPSWEGVKTAAGIVEETAGEAFDFIVDKIRELVREGIDWLTEKWNSLEEFATSAFTAAQDFFTNIIGFIKNPLGFLADAVMSLDEQSIAKAWATFSGLVSTLANNFKLLTDNLLGPLNSMWSKIQGFADSVLAKVSGLFGKLPGALQRVAATVIEPLKRLWESIKDSWTKLVAKIKAWVESALDTILEFVRRVTSFAIDAVITGIVQFAKLVLFIKDLFSDPQKYVEILAGKGVAAFAGAEALFSGLVEQHFGGEEQAQPAPATAVQRQPDVAAEPKRSATGREVGRGVLKMMGKKWEEFKSDPLSVLKTLLIDMIFPLIGDIKDVTHLFQEIKKIVTEPLSAGSLEELWTSLLKILDIPVLIMQTVVAILMRNLTLPLIVATFVPHPLVKGIAAAVGYALLGAFVNAELLNIAHKLTLLRTGATTEEEKGEAYNRIADSLIAMAMTAVIIAIIILLHFLANVVKGVYNFVKGKIVPVERVPVEAKPGSPTEGRSKGTPEEGKAGEAKGPREVPSEDGQRKLRMNEEGRCEVCASPCQEVRDRYRKVMTREIDAEISRIEGEALTEAQQLERLKPIEQRLAKLTKVAPEIDQMVRSRQITPEEGARLKEQLGSGDTRVRAEAEAELAELRREAASGEFEDQPRRERISDANKAELENSGWLKERLPDAKHRRAFMKWLERGHKQGEAHEHLRPGSSEAEARLQDFAEETGTPIVTHQ